MSKIGPEDERERIEYELRGKTLKVYLYLLKQRKSVGIREVQRELSFSSPSIAAHHMDKLLRLGIVEQDQYSNYVLAKKVDPSVLQAFVNVGRFTLPRVGFYAAFFSTIASAYIIQNMQLVDVYALIGGLGAALVFWYEAWRAWRRKPF
jgi:predicted DNA-binding transcriptional regulator